MLMERFALSRMKEWKENENRKPLIIRGARQVGKTWIMKTFGQQYFEKTAYVNFDNNARMKHWFYRSVLRQEFLLRQRIR